MVIWKNQKTQDFENRKQVLVQSSDYIFIQQFSQKYKNYQNDDDINKLLILLHNKQWKFSPEELKSILLHEDLIQESKYIKTKILKSNPTDFDGFIRSYIEVYGNNSEKLNILAELLQSRGIHQ